jgi:hypothetical protein
MSEVTADDALEIDDVDPEDVVDEDDDDSVDYPDPEDVSLDDPLPDEDGDDTIHAQDGGGA